METPFDRTEMLLGQGAMEKLKAAKVIVFGIGGVGGYAAEALVRSGIGHLVLVDHDRVSLTNLNRQITALHSTIGRYKVDVMRERALDINPEADIEARRCFFLPENEEEFDFSDCSYVVDAVDTVTAKLAIIQKARLAAVPVISAMGAGNKLDPTAFRVADIRETSVCPLARVMRRELKKRNISGVKVVYSGEEPLCPRTGTENTGDGRKAVPGSTAFVPPAAGLILAGEVVKDIVRQGDEEKTVRR